MTSTKTHNTSIQSAKGSSFFVSDEISHLVSEETLLRYDDLQDKNDDSFFATSDIVAKVSTIDDLFYADVVQFNILEKTIKIRSGVKAFKILYVNPTVTLQILTKDAVVDDKLRCQFKQFDEISRGDYIYSLNVFENINEVLDAY